MFDPGENGMTEGQNIAPRIKIQASARMITEEDRKQRDFNKLTRLMISIHDFEQSRSAATFLLEEVNDAAKYPLVEMRRFRCLETAMVVAYARPFSMAKGEVGPLTWKDTKLSPTPEEKGLHQKLIKHRNTLYGHSDAEFVKMKVWFMQETSGGRDVGMVFPQFDEHMRFSLAEINAVHEITLKLIHALVHQCAEQGAQFGDRFLQI